MFIPSPPLHINHVFTFLDSEGKIISRQERTYWTLNPVAPGLRAGQVVFVAFVGESVSLCDKTWFWERSHLRRIVSGVSLSSRNIPPVWGWEAGTGRRFCQSAACEICTPACSYRHPESLRGRQSIKKWSKKNKGKGLLGRCGIRTHSRMAQLLLGQSVLPVQQNKKDMFPWHSFVPSHTTSSSRQTPLRMRGILVL